MAVSAICYNTSLSELPVMIIFMAIFTLLPDLPETPFFIFLMTLCARRCNVSSIKREFAVVVPFN
jgi:Ca2+/Na+ antiporter